MNILVTMPLEAEEKARIIKTAPQADFVFEDMDKVSDKQLISSEVILGLVPPERLKLATKLKWLQLNSSGADSYCAPGVLPKGAILTNVTGAYGLAISEYMVGVVFELAYNLHKYRDNQKNRLWRDEGTARSLASSTVLVVGLGDIGSSFAVKMKAMGSHVIGIRRSLTAKPDYVDEIYQMDKLDELLPKADVVTLSLPNSPETAGLMNEARLLSMKKDAILVNVGRGPAVCIDDLCRVLKAGHLKGCALDVTDPEPLPAEHPLWGIENMVITPHISGGYHLQETSDRIIKIVLQNLEAFVQGKPLYNLVDFKTGYLAKKH
ncbi:MAG: D-2-hydroxyacid dehydrogenase [Clostridia bacterium]|nr:D-2-hydroxyacid dehydrogenase [Clostridia bacterium]